MNEQDALPYRVPDCPRCGYELRGLRIPGGEQPSGAGQCPECGLTFEWSELLNPLYLAPKWFVEIGHGKFLRKSLMTTFQSLFPWKFWRVVQMRFPQRYGAAFWSVIVGMAAMWIASCIVSAVWSIAFDSIASQYPWSTSVVDDLTRRPLRTIIELIWPEDEAVLRSPWLVTMYVACIVMPISMQLAPETLRRAKVLNAHLWRVALYSIAPVLLASTGPDVLRAGWWLIDVGLRDMSYSTGGSEFMFENAWWVRPSVAYSALTVAWGFACSRYVKLPRPWLVAGLLSMISVMVGALLTILTMDSYALFGN